MTLKPVVASPHMTVRDVAGVMDRHGVGSVLIKQGPQLLGIVTESDFVRRCVLEGHNPTTTPIYKIMSRDMTITNPDMDIFDALLLMRDADVRHVPVVEEGRLVGLITMKDILKIQPHLFENIVDRIELREEHRKPLGRIRTAELDDD